MGALLAHGALASEEECVMHPDVGVTPSPLIPTGWGVACYRHGASPVGVIAGRYSVGGAPWRALCLFNEVI